MTERKAITPIKRPFHGLKFKIIQPNPKRLVVKLRGEFVDSHALRAKARILTALKSLHEGTMAFETSEVGHIDSVGITVLLNLYESTNHKKIKMEIQNPSIEMLKLLKLTKVDHLFKIIG